MEEKLLGREDILGLLKSTSLLGEECWLTSGAALVLYGVKEGTRDIDLVCTTALADRLEAEGIPFRRSPLGVRAYLLIRRRLKCWRIGRPKRWWTGKACRWQALGASAGRKRLWAGKRIGRISA